MKFKLVSLKLELPKIVFKKCFYDQRLTIPFGVNFVFKIYFITFYFLLPLFIFHSRNQTLLLIL